jgi:hypothetical protein
MNRQTQKRRLERAGYVYLAGWIPKKNPQGPKFAAQVEMHRDDVARVVAEPPRRRGRPKKEN